MSDGSENASDAVVGRDALIAAPCVRLLPAGKILDGYIQNISAVYSCVSVDHYVIMPNHVHLLLSINGENAAMWASRPTRNQPPLLSLIVRSVKALTTKSVGQAIFQSSYHDHIIRSDADYLDHWNYIDANPAKWSEDEYYNENTN